MIAGIINCNLTYVTLSCKYSSGFNKGDKVKWLILLLSLVILNAYASEKKILMFISNGFYAPEYYKPRAIFEANGYKITVAAKYNGLTMPDKRNIDSMPVRADITFENVDVDKYDAFVFVGGNGAWEDFFPNETVHRLLSSSSLNRSKVVALLCSSTGLLGVANNLSGTERPIAEGRHVTGYKRVVGLLTVLGKVHYDPGIKGKPHVIVDKNLITGRDPISSNLFAETIVDALK